MQARLVQGRLRVGRRLRCATQRAQAKMLTRACRPTTLLRPLPPPPPAPTGAGPTCVRSLNISIGASNTDPARLATTPAKLATSGCVPSRLSGG